MTQTLIVRRGWDRIATTALFVANGLGFGIWAGNVPRLQEAQGLSDAGLGLLLLTISGGAVAAMPMTGWLASRVDAARLAVLAGLLGPPLLCLPALVSGWPALAASGVAFGMALGAMDVAMNGHASAVERAWGAPIMSSFHAGWSVGGLAGSAAAAALAAAGVGLALSYALPAVAIAALALLAITQRDASGPPSRQGFALPRGKLLGVAAVAALCFMTEGAVGDWSGVYLRTVVGTDAATAASAFGFYSLAMATGRIVGDAVVRRAGPPRVVRLGATLAAVGFALMLGVGNRVAADAGLVLVGLGLANIVPIAFSAAGRLHGAAGIAMAATSGYAGFMTSPPVIGAVADAIGLRAALVLVLAGVVAMVGLGRSVAPPTPGTA